MGYDRPSSWVEGSLLCSWWLYHYPKRKTRERVIRALVNENQTTNEPEPWVLTWVLDRYFQDTTWKVCTAVEIVIPAGFWYCRKELLWPLVQHCNSNFYSCPSRPPQPVLYFYRKKHIWTITVLTRGAWTCHMKMIVLPGKNSAAATGKRIWMLLSKYMSNSTTRNNLQRSTALPHTEGNFYEKQSMRQSKCCDYNC